MKLKEFLNLLPDDVIDRGEYHVIGPDSDTPDDEREVVGLYAYTTGTGWPEDHWEWVEYEIELA